MLTMFFRLRGANEYRTDEAFHCYQWIITETLHYTMRHAPIEAIVLHVVGVCVGDSVCHILVVSISSSLFGNTHNHCMLLFTCSLTWITFVSTVGAKELHEGNFSTHFQPTHVTFTRGANTAVMFRDDLQVGLMEGVPLTLLILYTLSDILMMMSCLPLSM